MKRRGTDVQRLLLATIAMMGASLCACSSSTPQNAAQPPAAALPAQTPAQRYDLKGKVVSVDKSARKLTVDHEAIPGFMGAMTKARLRHHRPSAADSRAHRRIRGIGTGW
jgi:Cu/Ag efflux protein CusF